MSNSQSFSIRFWLSSNRYQVLAFLFCFLFGAALIANVELGGEASWFWYATLVHHGVRLYADLHTPLQPFYVLETDVWMMLTGKSVLAYETLALIHVFVLCLGMLLLLRESAWPDWRKACIFAMAFFVDIFFVAFRFDDFHVVNDIFVLYAMVVLLRLYHAETLRRQLTWVAVAGVIAGLSFTNRSTDGGTLLTATGLCVLFLSQRSKTISTVLYSLCVGATIALIVHLTGDTFHDYLANSIFHAAAAKGGTSVVMRGPYLAVLDNLHRVTHSKRSFWFLGLVAVGALARRYWKDTAGAVVSAELVAAVLAAFGLALMPIRRALWNGVFITSINATVQTLLYLLCLWVVIRLLMAKFGSERRRWDAREMLIFIPVATLVSAAVSQANGTSNSTISMALLFLLATFWLPFDGRFRWLSDSVVAVALVIAVAGMVDKANTPYWWNAYLYQPMFQGREWYRHPVYGPMYIESNALRFNQSVCRNIDPQGPQPEFLSLPYSYANYFCATPPWHNYVQTWFDTTTPETVQTLMQQLNDAPPKWILYERQIFVLSAHEVEYNGGKPIAHRALDEMIMEKLASHQWKLVDRQDYLEGEGWYLIQTHP